MFARYLLAKVSEAVETEIPQYMKESTDMFSTRVCAKVEYYICRTQEEMEADKLRFKLSDIRWMAVEESDYEEENKKFLDYMYSEGILKPERELFKTEWVTMDDLCDELRRECEGTLDDVREMLQVRMEDYWEADTWYGGAYSDYVFIVE